MGYHTKGCDKNIWDRCPSGISPLGEISHGQLSSVKGMIPSYDNGMYIMTVVHGQPMQPDHYIKFVTAASKVVIKAQSA